MASGTPVITSLSSSLPEVVDNAALMVNPLDTKQIAESIESILHNPDLAKHLIARGYKQVKNFNWQRVARNVLTIYNQVYNLGPHKSPFEPGFISFKEWQALKTQEEGND